MTAEITRNAPVVGQMGRQDVQQQGAGVVADPAGVAIGQTRGGRALARHAADPLRKLGQAAADDRRQLQAKRQNLGSQRTRTLSNAALSGSRRPAAAVLHSSSKISGVPCSRSHGLHLAEASCTPSGANRLQARQRRDSTGAGKSSWPSRRATQSERDRSQDIISHEAVGGLVLDQSPHGANEPCPPAPDNASSRLRRAASGAVSTSVRIICSLWAAIAAMIPRKRRACRWTSTMFETRLRFPKRMKIRRARAYVAPRKAQHD